MSDGLHLFIQAGSTRSYGIHLFIQAGSTCSYRPQSVIRSGTDSTPLHVQRSSQFPLTLPPTSGPQGILRRIAPCHRRDSFDSATSWTLDPWTLGPWTLASLGPCSNLDSRRYAAHVPAFQAMRPNGPCLPCEVGSCRQGKTKRVIFFR